MHQQINHDSFLIIFFLKDELAKEGFTEIKDVSRLNILPDLIRHCKSARMRYGVYLEDEKKKKAVSEHEKRKRNIRDEIAGEEEKAKVTHQKIAWLNMVSIYFIFINHKLNKTMIKTWILKHNLVLKVESLHDVSGENCHD